MICHSCSIAMVSCLFHPFPSGWYGTRVQELVGASDTSTLSPRTASRLRSSWMARRYGRKRCWIVYRPENQATKLYSYFLDKRSFLQPTTTSLAPLTCSLGPISVTVTPTPWLRIFWTCPLKGDNWICFLETSLPGNLNIACVKVCGRKVRVSRSSRKPKVNQVKTSAPRRNVRSAS